MKLPQYLRRDFFRSPGAIAMTRFYLVNGLIIPHSHDFVEVVLVVDGEGVHRSHEGESLIQRGQVLVIRPGAWHTYEACVDLKLYNCCFGYELLGHELAWFGEDARLNYLFHVGPLSQGRRGILATTIPATGVQACERHLLTLCDLEQRPTLADKTTTLACLLLFFGELAQAITPGDLATGQTHPAVLEAVRLLEQDAPEAWTMALLAHRVGLSEAYLSRLFRHQMGAPPMTYLHQRRMERGANLLLHTNWPIGRIALEIGLDDQNYFARCFKAYYGLSATDYRKQFAGR
ncbi:MAG: AraC family transcriptional regulator [Caldilinea sp. CFX5]|nr:AraC family transcriptional regulator [Caldilinea sp. CFX5]